VRHAFGSVLRLTAAGSRPDEFEQRFYTASLDSARGLEPQPSEALHREVEESQVRCRALLRLMLRDFALQAASARAVKA
jgi:hypothetical protein